MRDVSAALLPSPPLPSLPLPSPPPVFNAAAAITAAVGETRNVESYSQLREAAKQIIARVAGRLSGTVGRSGLMDPAVTGLERAAVVANTPITFRPRELLGVRLTAAYAAYERTIYIYIYIYIYYTRSC